MDTKKFNKMWQKIRSSVNGMGPYQARDAAREKERVAREQQQIERREAVLREQIASLQNQVVSIRNAATNHIFSQLQ
jgi:hypothetical protein